MNDITEIPQWGFFALVSYIPDPLGSFLHGLRQILPGENHSQPHITILPPRPLMLPVEAASQQAHDILLNFAAFEIELSEVRCFPETNVLYLDIARGNRRVHDLHAALNTGNLRHTEQFDFRPHLTLGGPVPAEDCDAVRRRAEMVWRSSDCPRRFVLDEIVLVALRAETPQGEWRRLWSHTLSTKTSGIPLAAAAAFTTRTC